MADKKEVFNELMRGNERFVRGELENPHCSTTYRKGLTAGQNPGAVVLTCSDSRTPPELIFDQGLGDIFVIRTAGLCIDDITIGSIEYAVEHLKVPLVLVLGHEKCGAVAASMENDDAPSPHLKSIINFIKPAIAEAKNKGTENLDEVIKCNTLRIVETLKNSTPVLSQFFKDKSLDIVGCHYLLETGKVEILPED